jgi:hypothetical protein
MRVSLFVFMRYAIEQEKTLNPKKLEGEYAKMNEPLRSDEKKKLLGFLLGFFMDSMQGSVSDRVTPHSRQRHSVLEDYVEPVQWLKSECDV